MTTGKVYTAMKKDDLVKHERSVDHRHALKLPAMQKSLQMAKVKAYSSVKSAVISQMATILTQAEEAIPSTKNSKLIKLQIFNGVTSLKHLQPSDGRAYYQHNDSINEFYDVKAQLLKNDMLHDREMSHPFYGIDEADRSGVAPIKYATCRTASATRCRPGRCCAPYMGSGGKKMTGSFQILE